MAVDGARERLQAAASRRKAGHDQRVKELSLREGQLVYLRDYGVRGRHKIHDLWSSTVYQVVKAPSSGGSVYTVAPVNDLTQVRHIHRSALKPRVQGEVVSEDFSESAGDSPVPSEPELELEDGDLVYVVSEVPLLAHGGSTMRSDPSGMVLVDDPPAPPLESSNPLRVVPRQTGRVGAGQHSNVHRLPRAIGAGNVNPPACGASAVMAWFRPWK